MAVTAHESSGPRQTRQCVSLRAVEPGAAAGRSLGTALLAPSPLEGVSQHRPHVPAWLAHARPAAPDQHNGQHEPDRYDPEHGIVCHSASEPYSTTSSARLWSRPRAWARRAMSKNAYADRARAAVTISVSVGNFPSPASPSRAHSTFVQRTTPSRSIRNCALSWGHCRSMSAWSVSVFV
jgi:hypothetical protein